MVGREYLVLLRRGQNKDGVGGRLFKGLQESVERCRRQHVDLVDDEHFVFPDLRRDVNLLDERTDVLDGVVGGRIEFMDVIAALLVEGHAALTVPAGFALGRRRETVDGFGKNAGARGFPDAARAAKEVGVGQLAGCDGVFQRRGQGFLPDDGVERRRTVLARRYDIMFHGGYLIIQQ